MATVKELLPALIEAANTEVPYMKLQEALAFIDEINRLQQMALTQAKVVAEYQSSQLNTTEEEKGL